jgi:hypothetical protein
MKTCEKYIEVFNGGFLKVCILKIYIYVLQKLPYFMYKKIKFLIGYIQFDHDSIYRNTRRNTDCDCKFLTISIKLFKKFKEFKFGEHWCDILLKEGYLK